MASYTVTASSAKGAQSYGAAAAVTSILSKCGSSEFEREVRLGVIGGNGSFVLHLWSPNVMTRFSEVSLVGGVGSIEII